MSKSKGNVIDPLDIVDGISLDDTAREAHFRPHAAADESPAIEKAPRVNSFRQGIAAYGTDALRLCIARLATQSRDLRFDMAQALRSIATSATSCGMPSRYVLMNVEGEAQDLSAAAAEFSLADRWIRKRGSADMLGRIEAGFVDYRFDVVANALYDFTWHEFCDWYVELSKAVLQSPIPPRPRQKARHAPYAAPGTLEVLLRAHAPRSPHLSSREEIWQRLRGSSRGPAGETIMRAPISLATRIDQPLIDKPRTQRCVG